MLESIKNYRQILSSGMLFKDIQAMEDFILAPDTLCILICHIPTQLSLSEGKELREHLEDFLIETFKCF